MHLISIKNNILIKKVAVASLAALMTIPNLMITTYAKTQITVEMAQEKLEYWKSLKDNFSEKISKDISMKDIDDSIQDWQETLDDVKAGKVIWSYNNKEEYNKDKAKRNQERANLKAQQAAVQAEKDRIANTVYPLTARYVKDFVPAVDDYQPHFYERADLPGVIFTLQQDSFGKLVDVKPNLVIVEDNDIERVVPMFDGSSYDTIFQVIKVKYISPFNFAGRINLGEFHADYVLNKVHLGAGWCHYIGENMECFMIDGYHYTPTDECIKKFQELMPEYLPTIYNTAKLYSEKPKLTVEEIKSKGKVYFHTEERVKKSSGINKKLGATWVNDQDIFSVAKEHGTDYTDEERQTLVIKPTPVSPYTNAGSEPIVDEQEWIDANINYDRNPQSLSDEEWWK